jgi:hypothetical protein
MPAAFPIRWQINWRLQSAKQRLAVALVISLVLHAIIYGAWLVAPATAKFLKEAFERVPVKNRTQLQREIEPPPTPKREVPMVFVEVDPALASKEPPKETKNYSTANSIAANPTPKNAETPKIEGKQTPVLRMMDVPKPQPKPLEPKPLEPEPPEKESTEQEVKPKATPPPGDLAMAKSPSTAPKAPELTPQKDGEQTKPRPKPRTLQEARARNPALAGQKSQQDGGVQQRAHIAMVDARSSVFGEYDRAFISLVQSRWYQLLDGNQYMMDRRGKVSLSFRLHFDGRISQVEVVENTVGDMLSLLCQKSILDPAPFPKWPAEMRRQIQGQSGTEYRDVKFTFYYD